MKTRDELDALLRVAELKLSRVVQEQRDCDDFWLAWRAISLPIVASASYLDAGYVENCLGRMLSRTGLQAPQIDC